MGRVLPPAPFVFMKTFLARYLAGEANIEDIHAAIDQWSFHRTPELHEWLGLLPSEYQIFYDNEWKFARYLIHLKNAKG
jgi:hypothetical protein